MGCDYAGSVICPYSWTSDNQGNVDVLFVAARLSWLKTMLTDVETIVAAVDYVSIVYDTMGFEPLEEAVDQFIDCLQCS